MRCEEIMKRDVECISPDDTAQAAAQRMRDENVGLLPVCDEDEKVIGTVSDRDLAIRVIADGRTAMTTIDNVLTREVVACKPEDDVRVAEELMGKHHKSRVMCIDDDGRLVGIISLSDMAQNIPAARASRVLREITEREVRA